METQPTLVEKNMGKMHANMHIRTIAREKKVDFTMFTAKLVKDGLWRQLSDAITNKKDPEPILKKIRNYELV